MNRNRFSAVATISVPTLGIKGKKITKEERYLETIDPAPATPAGQPLGEIEVEVSAEVAQRLKLGWSVEVAKNDDDTTDAPTPPLLLETTYTAELVTPTPRQKTPAPQDPSASSPFDPQVNSPSNDHLGTPVEKDINSKPPTTFLLATTHPSPLQAPSSENCKNTHTLSSFQFPDGPRVFSPPQCPVRHDKPTQSSEIAAPEARVTQGAETHLPLTQAFPLLEVASPEKSATDRVEIEPTSSAQPLLTAEECETTHILPESKSLSASKGPLPAAQPPLTASSEPSLNSAKTNILTKAIVSETSRNDGEQEKALGTKDSSKEVTRNADTVVVNPLIHPDANDLPTQSAGVGSAEASTSLSDTEQPLHATLRETQVLAEDDTLCLQDQNLPTPPHPQPPSLFRSRSFAALIDIAVASSFFVLGLLFFPDPPRILPFVFAALYLLTKDSLGILNGQSIGKKLMRLRVVNRNHRSLAGNYKAGLKRNLSWIVAPIEFAILYVREDEVTIGKRLGDDWAKTEVIIEKDASPRKSKWLP